jgi:hypothetical protein
MPERRVHAFGTGSQVAIDVPRLMLESKDVLKPAIYRNYRGKMALFQTRTASRSLKRWMLQAGTRESGQMFSRHVTRRDAALDWIFLRRGDDLKDYTRTKQAIRITSLYFHIRKADSHRMFRRVDPFARAAHAMIGPLGFYSCPPWDDALCPERTLNQ